LEAVSATDLILCQDLVNKDSIAIRTNYIVS
jgi:hypothetical protein